MQPIAPNCPICNKPMVLRRGRTEFWGCSSFPRCRGTKSLEPINGNNKPKKEFIPSVYQEAVKQFVLTGSGNAVVKAVAGSGKTTTIEWISQFLPKDKNIVYLVFNTHVKEEAVKKMPSWVSVMTTHQLGFQAIRSFKNKIDVDADKVGKIIKKLLNATWDDEKWMISQISKLVGLCKNLLVEPNNAELADLVNFYRIDVNDSFDRIAELTRLSLTECNRQLDVIDFDDMLYLPIKLGLPIPKFDWILGDEIQDFNNAQVELILRARKTSGRVIAVGDSDQSLYGFRGACVDAFDNVKDGLQAIELPLSISYRVPLCCVRFVNYQFPDIKFEAFEKAIEGEIKDVKKDEFLSLVQDGDMVLCRTNAPLVAYCFALIGRGKKAIIVGREIGKGLVNFIEKFKKTTVEDLLDKLEDYRIKESAKLAKKEHFIQIEALNDKIDTIIALSDNCTWTSQVVDKIKKVFSDTAQGVSFSTVHRAKGLEADNVFILEPQLLPHPMAKLDWERVQERNAAYVAYTRFKKTLTFVR